MLFGRFRILGKLTLLVLVPLLGVAALTVPLVGNRITAARAAGDSADLVVVAESVSTALQELQEERLLSVGYLFDLVDTSELVNQTTTTKDAIARIGDLGAQLSPALKQAVGWAGGLQRTRTAVLAKQTRPDQVVDDFTNVVTPIIDALNLSARADLTTISGRQIFALDQALRSSDMISQACSLLASAVATKQPGLINLFSTKLVELQSTVIRAEPFFTDPQYRLYLQAQSSFLARVGNNFFTLVRTNSVAAINLLNLPTLYPSMLSAIVLGGFVEKRIAADVDAAVTTNRQDAIRQAYLIVALALALLLVVIGLSVMMARAVARPLRRLTTSADRIARTAESELERVADDDVEAARPIRLDPVDVQAKDEIGDLARAFDRVQTTAVRLVERQVVGRRNVAQMFGHVGRRTQNLVGRQLALIDSLERRETDSDRLRELYRLDHMSSRLRRNASSLVVLSGGAGANDHMAPMPLSDVVRLALGEIEDYTRVDVEVGEDLAVLPAVVADLTLLLAELMENATAFSPPHTRVTVTAAESGSGVRLCIVDHGLGLPPERMAEENARLTTRERLDLAPSEVLGLFVVGRLARRHGLSVSLAETPGGGVTANVDMKQTHLLAQPESPAPAGAAPGPAPVPGAVAEFTPLIAGTAVRSAPGSAMPFDSHALSRATRTLEAGRSWNAFAPARGTAPAPAGAQLPVAGDDRPAPVSPPPVSPPPGSGAPVSGRPVSGSPVSGPPVSGPPVSGPPVSGPPVSGPPVSAPPAAPRSPAPLPEQPRSDKVAATPAEPGPVAGQAWELAGTAEMPITAADPGPYANTATPIVLDGPGTIQVPRQRTPNGPLRRRVPGSQLPVDAAPKLPAAPPTPDDAAAARDLVEAFEAGVSRAKWDVIEADLAAPPAAGHAPLARRVPGATLGPGEPVKPPAATTPARPMNPDEARDLIEQFEYGVALALNEVRPQHEGQPR